MLFENNSNAADLIQSDAGEHCFCRYCKLEDKCHKTGLPKVLPINMKIYKYAKMAMDKHIEYPYRGSWELQPAYFIALFEKAKTEILIQKKSREDDDAAGK